MLPLESRIPTSELGLLFRVKLLSEIKRYKDYPDMIHRPDLFTHTFRTSFLARSMGLQLNELDGTKYHFDLHLLHRMGSEHDDGEFLTDDIVAPVKHALRPQELSILQEKEAQGVVAVARFLYGFQTRQDEERYLTEQEALREKKTPEAQLVDVADKWDALGEILHDIRCGNEDFMKLIPYSQKKFAEFQEYPFWKDLSTLWDLKFDKIYADDFIDQVQKASRISIEDLPSRESIAGVMHGGWYLDWPDSHRWWNQISKQIFYLNPEKYIFPGWYLDLWKKWGKYPHGSSTTSGILLP